MSSESNDVSLAQLLIIHYEGSEERVPEPLKNILDRIQPLHQTQGL
jgi:hypothetical protein